MIMYTAWLCKTALTSVVLEILGADQAHTFITFFYLLNDTTTEKWYQKPCYESELFFWYDKRAAIHCSCIITVLLQLCKDDHAIRTFCWRWFFRQPNLLNVQNADQSLFKCFDLLSPWTHPKITIIKNNYGESRLHCSTISLMGMWMPLK